MENIQIIISTAATALGLLATTLTFLIRFVKSAKARRAAEQLLSLTNAVIPFIEQAEQFANYSGEEKKEFVLTKANQYAIDNMIKFDPNIISEKIEELVKLTKDVNVRKKEPEEVPPEKKPPTNSRSLIY